MAQTRVGLRERKKSDTRRHIIRTANRLFRRHGYDAVTLEQIADACVMSVRTILRYFTTKEALALAGEHDLLAMFQSRLAERETDAVTCWREFQLETLHLTETPESRKRMIAILASAPMLSEFLRIGQTYEDVLAEAIAEECVDAPQLETAVFASLLVSSSSAAFRRWLTSDEQFDPVVLGSILDRVCAAFDHRQQPRGRVAKRRRGNNAAAG